jgi:biotin synthase
MTVTANPPAPLTRDAVAALYDLPFPELLFRAMSVHRQFNDPAVIQHCTLCNIKEGGCPEDCGYCSQSAHHKTGVKSSRLLDVESVVEAAREAKAAGSTRFCMGAAWRGPRDSPDFDSVLEMVREVRALGMETCVTLGLLTADQARRLAEAGLKAYNHNIDTSPEYYEKVITTRKFEDRLQTIGHVRDAGIEVCCGGILGMGESREDRIGMLTALAAMDPQPESVPINALVAVEGTPLEHAEPVDSIELVRTIATARITMPRSRVRLSAGRREMSDELQALCFAAGANSIFAGEKLLTTANPGSDRDRDLLQRLGMEPEAAPSSVAARTA